MYEEGWAEYRKVRNRFWAFGSCIFRLLRTHLALGLIFAGFIAFGMGLAICWIIVWAYYGFKLNTFLSQMWRMVCRQMVYNKSFLARSSFIADSRNSQRNLISQSG